MAECERHHRKHSDEEEPAEAVQGKRSSNSPICAFLLREDLFFKIISVSAGIGVYLF